MPERLTKEQRSAARALSKHQHQERYEGALDIIGESGRDLHRITAAYKELKAERDALLARAEQAEASRDLAADTTKFYLDENRRLRARERETIEFLVGQLPASSSESARIVSLPVLAGMVVGGMHDRAGQAEAERGALLDILERLHSVQDGCPLHRHNAVWVKAMEDAQAAFARAGGGA